MTTVTGDSSDAAPPTVDVNTAVDGTQDTDQPDPDRRPVRLRRKIILIRCLLMAPYFMGILWTSLHPIVSVLTGEAKCRGWYLDENSIETRFADGKANLVPPYLAHLKNEKTASVTTTAGSGSSSSSSSSSLCARLAAESTHHHNLVQCHVHGEYFEVARVVPLSNALDASEEALVFVVPNYYINQNNSNNSTNIKNNNKNNNNMFHRALVAALHQLADPKSTPWLAKTVLVVTPTRPEMSLEETTQAFLDAYLGSSQTELESAWTMETAGTAAIPPLLPSWSGAILRTLLVLDLKDDSTRAPQRAANNNRVLYGTTDLQILPQGRRGVLPNADLVFLVGKLMEKTTFMNMRMYPSSTFLAHGFVQESKRASVLVDQVLAGFQKQKEHYGLTINPQWLTKFTAWAKNMSNLGLFVRTMALGPFPPHAAALDRGIDSLTLQVAFSGVYRRDPSVEFVQYTMEYLVRALSNLHERLHHSQTLYLLPSPMTFVSHLEYFLPNALVLLPLAVRAFGMLLPQLQGGLDLTAVGLSLLTTAVTMINMASGNPDDEHANDKTSGAMRFLYLGFTLLWVRHLRSTNDDGKDDGNSKDENGESPPCKVEDESRPENDESEITDGETVEEVAKGRTIRTFQFMACVSAAYFLVPIAFAHTSLSYLPSLIWTPLLAFPDYSSKNGTALSQLTTFLLILVAMATAPPLLLVPAVFATYTPFVQLVYVPLHLHFFLLVVLSLLR